MGIALHFSISKLVPKLVFYACGEKSFTPLTTNDYTVVVNVKESFC
jgi:hypothetical protein